MKKILDQLNPINQCRQYHVKLWQCPHFLTIITGLIILVSMVATYFISSRYIIDPEIVALIVIVTTIILLIVNYLIIHSFDSLARANQMKTEFVSIASHQLRTPLSSIKWLLDVILKDKDKKIFNSEQMDVLNNIGENNQRMIDLVNDLLNVSRIEEGKILIRPEKTNLKKVSEKIFEEYSHLAKASNIKLSLKAEDNLQDVWCDPERIKLVIENLVENSIRYIKGEGWVEVKLENRNKSVRFKIKDNGVGIPQGEQKNIFQKFFRSENALKYQTSGTGLGLFIAKSIIEASDGKINFKSEENKGTTFWFELPIK